MPPLLAALLCSAAVVVLHLPLAAVQAAAPGSIVLPNYGGGVMSADTNVSVYDGNKGALKFTMGPFNAPAGLVINPFAG